MRFSLILPLALPLALALTACASDEKTLKDPLFKAGYEAGCGMAHSAREVRAAMTKDQPELYRRGFSAGFTACGGEREIGR